MIETSSVGVWQRLVINNLTFLRGGSNDFSQDSFCSFMDSSVLINTN